ncbi:MAG: hypothetical protein Q8O55_12325 [Dehalococcoidales bacterium]|nr:hypothetical protein [Dehalococcoidales bacterium]
MKNKISKILGVGLSLAMLLSFLMPTIPASAGTLSWSGEGDVEDLIDTIDYVLGPADVDIVDMAVNGDVIYAVTNTTDNATFKSTNGGATWTSLVSSTDYPGGSSGAPVLVAVAPDNPDVVAIVTDEPEVWLSDDGGSDWDDLNITSSGSFAVATINDIDISPGSTYYVAVGGSTSSGAEMWTLKLAMAEIWEAESDDGTSAGSGNVTSTDEVYAVKFSPNFQTDKAIVAVSGDNSSTADPYLHLFRWKEDDLGRWNSEATAYDEMDDWADGLAIDTETSISGGMGKADIALPDTFLATEVFERLIVVAVAGATSGGGLNGFTDTIQNQWEDWAGNDLAVGIGSVAIHPDGKTIAGEYNDNVVYAFSKFTGTPEAERTNSLKGPGGANRTLVAWSGDTAVATTSGDESAFSVSTDDGYAWNDISMIDTVLSVLDDVAATADAKKYYLTSHDTSDGTGTYDTSVWLNDGSWTRVLSMVNRSDNDEAAFMVRLAPEDDAVVFVAAEDSQDMWKSTDSGMTRWRALTVDELTTIQDFVVESADVIYAIDTVGASKSTTGGAGWETKIGLDGVSGFMVTLAPNGDVLVGGSDGYVAFSKDGGLSFTKITDRTDNANVYVVADEKYAESNILFIAAGDEVEIGEADKNESWSSFEPDALNGTVSGIAFYKGVLWVLTDNTSDSDSKLWRSLNPYDPDTETLALWSRTLEEDVDLNGAQKPQGLKASFANSKGPKFWAIDAAADPEDQLSSVADPLALAGPTVSSPEDGSVVQVNTASGGAYNITFSWKRYSYSKVLNMDLEISSDKDFTALIVDTTVTDLDRDNVSLVVGPTADEEASFNPGQTYYWRVRHSAAQPTTQDADEWHWNSPWSKVGSFTVEDLAAAPFSIVTPASGANDVPIQPTLTWTPYEGAIHYEVALAEDPTFSILDFSYTADNTFFKVPATDELKYNTTYYWRVRGVTGPEAIVNKVLVVPAGPWEIGIFTTMAEPVVEEPTVIVQPGVTPPAQIVQVPVPQPSPIPSGLLWAVIAIGAVLVIALIVLIVRTRRVA